MAKQNAMLAKIEAKYRAYYDKLFHDKLNMVLQMGQDVAMITANDVLQMGKGRAAKFADAYMGNMNEMCHLIFDDQQDDEAFSFSKEKIDQRLRSVVGEENFCPWGERYGTD